MARGCVDKGDVTSRKAFTAAVCIVACIVWRGGVRVGRAYGVLLVAVRVGVCVVGYYIIHRGLVFSSSVSLRLLRRRRTCSQEAGATAITCRRLLQRCTSVGVVVTYCCSCSCGSHGAGCGIDKGSERVLDCVCERNFVERSGARSQFSKVQRVFRVLHASQTPGVGDAAGS